MKKIILVSFLVFIGWQTSVLAQDAPGGGVCGSPGAPACPPAASVPEPSILWLMVGGLASFGVVRYLKKRK